MSGTGSKVANPIVNVRSRSGGFGRPVTPSAVFECSYLNSGFSKFENTITENSQSVTPTFLYHAGNISADTNTWTALIGEDLSNAKGSPVTDWGAPFTDSTTSVEFVGGEQYNSTTNFAAISTEDVVFEFCFYNGTQTSKYLFAMGDTGGVKGPRMLISSASLQIVWEGAGATVSTFATLTQDAWQHVMIFGNVSENSTDGCRVYVNGQNKLTSGNNLSTVGSLDSAAKVSVGARDAGFANMTGKVAWLAMWKEDTWLTEGSGGPTAWGAIAAERFLKIAGVWPEKNTSATEGPTLATRTSIAYLEKAESDGKHKLYPVGANWPRIVTKRSHTDSTVSITGLMSEGNVLNKCLQSEDFDTTWTKAGCTITTDQEQAPDGLVAMDAVVTADAITDEIHGVTQAVTVTAAAWVFAVYAKAGNQKWLYMSDDTVANAFAYFDLENQVVGTEGAGINFAGVEPDLINGCVRCWIQVTGTAAAHTFKLLSSDTDQTTADPTYVGDGSSQELFLWGSQVHAHKGPRSYIKTTTGTVSKTVDKLKYSLADMGTRGECSGSFLSWHIPGGDASFSTEQYLTLSDGGATTDRIRVGQAVNAQVAIAIGGAAVTVDGTSGGGDGGVHPYAFAMRDNDYRMAYRSVIDTDFTTAGLEAIDTLSVGYEHTSDNQQTEGVVSKLKIWDRFVFHSKAAIT